MALEFAVGSFVNPASTGVATVVTGLSFQPSCVFFFPNLRHESIGTSYFQSFGAATSSTARACAGAFSLHNAGTSDVSKVFSDTSCYWIPGASQSTTLRADFDSFTSDGFKVDVINADATGQVPYMAFGGTDVSFKVGTFNLATGAGTQDVTGIGFDPKMVMLFSSVHNTTDIDSVVIHANIFLGASDGTNQIVRGWVDADNSVTSRPTHYYSHDEALANANTGSSPFANPAMDFEAHINSMITDGFQVDKTDGPASTTPIGYIAFGGSGLGGEVGRFKSGSVGTHDVTVTDDPIGVFHFGTENSADSETGLLIKSNSSPDFGAADGTNERSVSNAAFYQQYSASRIRSSANTTLVRGIDNFGTVYRVATLDSLGTGKFTIDITDAWDVNDNTGFITFAALGAAGQTIPVGQAQEDATAQSITPALDIAIVVAQAQEDTTAQVITPALGVSAIVGQAQEDTTAQIITPALGVFATVGQAQEDTTAQIITPALGVAATVGQAQEDTTAQVVTPLVDLVVAVEQAQEDDQAQGVGVAGQPITVEVGRAQEQCLGIIQFPRVAIKATVGQAQEDTTAQVITPVFPAVTVALGIAEETSTAQIILPSLDLAVLVGIASEDNSALAITFEGQASPIGLPYSAPPGLNHYTAPSGGRIHYTSPEI